MENECMVSIIIKALNEEANITVAIESALESIEGVGGEVILADSGSSDRTIEIASGYPIKIVQLDDFKEKCCGIGPQLGYQVAKGKYIYLLDADMRLNAGFVEKAIAVLEKDSELAGVGGVIKEQNLESEEFRRRAEEKQDHMTAGKVDRLDGGGLYKKEVIEKIGYFSDRNLHSYEEFDLAMRINKLGKGLARIDEHAVDHWGHDLTEIELIRKRISSKYVYGIGEMLRASIEQGYLQKVIKHNREVKIYLVLLLFWFFLGSAVVFSDTRLVLFSCVPFLYYLIKKRDVIKAINAFVSVHVFLYGMIVGVLFKRKNPSGHVKYKIILRHDLSE